MPPALRGPALSYGSRTSLSQSAYPLRAAWGLAPLEQVPREHCERCGCRGSHLGSNQKLHWRWPPGPLAAQKRSPQQSLSVVHGSLWKLQQVPLWQSPLQHSVLAVQEFPPERHKRQKPKRLSQISLQH